MTKRQLAPGQPAQRGLAQEYPPPGEDAAIADLAARLQDKIAAQYRGQMVRRDAHPKMHGLVRAEFIVEPGLPDAFRTGVFADARTWPAWIRFSNQFDTIHPDSAKDIRGMAIKLMGVPGDKLLPEERDARTQDFILISTEVFVTHDAAEFDALIRALTGSVFAKLWFFLWHPRSLRNLWRSMRACDDPLGIDYFSTTPYLLGAQAVKYAAWPRDVVPPPGVDHGDPDFLRQAMVARLAAGDVYYDFLVQVQTDADAMPIEDPGRAWDTADSPFRKLATIRIPRQAFDSEAQRRYGENLSFTPWHALPEHRPLGGINRARRVVYDTISRFRHAQNGVPRHEPEGWEI